MSRSDPDNRPVTDHEAYAWVMRFAEGKANAADLAALRQWSARDPARAEAFDRISRTWRALGPLGRERAVAQLSCAPDQRAAGSTPRLGRRAFLGGALAASAAGAAVLAAHPPLGLWPSWSELAADYRTSTGEQRNVTLADHATIAMNTQTSLALRAGSAGVVELISGEAMISAARDAEALTVVAGGGRVVARDARFNIRAADDAVCVTCLVGEVRVEQKARAVPLLAGQQVRYSGRGLEPAVAANIALVGAWQDGIVIFQSTPVSEVIAELNRYRPGKIILTNPELGRRLFNARLRIATLDRVVSQIEQAFGARATRLPGGLVLLG